MDELRFSSFRIFMGVLILFQRDTYIIKLSRYDFEIYSFFQKRLECSTGSSKASR